MVATSINMPSRIFENHSSFTYAEAFAPQEVAITETKGGANRVMDIDSKNQSQERRDEMVLPPQSGQNQNRLSPPATLPPNTTPVNSSMFISRPKGSGPTTGSRIAIAYITTLLPRKDAPSSSDRPRD